MTFKSFLQMRIILFPLIFSAGFIAGVCWDSFFKEKTVYVLFIVAVVALLIITFFENLPILISNAFRPKARRKRVQWDPLASNGQWYE